MWGGPHNRRVAAAPATAPARQLSEGVGHWRGSLRLRPGSPVGVAPANHAGTAATCTSRSKSRAVVASTAGFVGSGRATSACKAPGREWRRVTIWPGLTSAVPPPGLRRASRGWELQVPAGLRQPDGCYPVPNRACGYFIAERLKVGDQRLEDPTSNVNCAHLIQLCTCGPEPGCSPALRFQRRDVVTPCPVAIRSPANVLHDRLLAASIGPRESYDVGLITLSSHSLYPLTWRRQGASGSTGRYDKGHRGIPVASLVSGRAMPGVGVEPTRPFGQRILSPPCLPFHHPGDVVAGQRFTSRRKPSLISCVWRRWYKNRYVLHCVRYRLSFPST
jgi:hypothetical protein